MSLVEVIIVRDPDGGTDVDVLVDGERHDVVTYFVDAGAGWVQEDWDALRDACVERASTPRVRAAVEEAFDNPPGSQYITV